MNTILDSYIKSIQNLLFLNEIYRLSNSKEYKKILKEPSRLKGNKLIVYITAILFSILFPLIVTFHFFIFFNRKRNCKFTDFEKLGGRRIFLLLLNKALFRVATSKQLAKDEDIWITENEDFCKDVLHCISMYRFVSYRDLVYSFLFAILSFYRSLFKYGIKVVFLGLDTYQWHVKYMACMNIPIDCELLFCNHMDPYAVLINSLPHKHKSLIQHGTLIILHNPYSIQWPYMKENMDLKYWTYNVPCKYNTIERVFTFSETEYHALCDSIIDNHPQKIIVGYGLKTYELEGSKKTVLIIGLYRKYFEKEREIIRQLQGLDINLVLKNHPTQSVAAYNDIKNKYNFILINENRFPKADIVISYDSTLALEYAESGSDVFYYDDFSIESIVSEIIKRFTESKE